MNTDDTRIGHDTPAVSVRWPVGAPEGVPCGTLIVSWHRDPDTLREWVTIDHADPRIVVTDEYVQRTMGQGTWSWFEPLDRGWTPGSTLVTFRGDNGDVVYRVADYDVARFLWLLVWPD